MIATKIIRRIDDLGRIVIPKVIRRQLHIQESTPFEIYINEDKLFTLKPYTPWENKQNNFISTLMKIEVLQNKNQLISFLMNMVKTFLKKQFYHYFVQAQKFPVGLNVKFLT